jgi:uncharacterized protein (TIGR02996 family)
MHPSLASLIASASDNDLDALLVLADFLEERGDERAGELRRLHGQLYDDLLFAPLAFRHFNLARDYILPFFAEDL